MNGSGLKTLFLLENMKSSFLENANGYTMVNDQFKESFYGKKKINKKNLMF